MKTMKNKYLDISHSFMCSTIKYDVIKLCCFICCKTLSYLTQTKVYIFLQNEEKVFSLYLYTIIFSRGWEKKVDTSKTLPCNTIITVFFV